MYLKMERHAQLSLGTVQWGKEYGWTNQSGRPSFGALEEMLSIARSKGVEYLDTAQAYGDAEKILGKLGAAQAGFKINTKLNQLSQYSDSTVREKFASSLHDLGVDRIESLMVHTVSELLGPNRAIVWDSFLSLLTEGMVNSIGVSIYHPSEIEHIIELEKLNIIQLPLNVYDQRFLNSGWLKELKQRNVKIQVRSVFLQGIITMKPEKLPAHLQGIRASHGHLFNCLKDADLSPVEGALQFCLSQPDVDQVIVGCESIVQLQQILAVFDKPKDTNTIDWAQFSQTDLNIVNPSSWPPKPSLK